MSADLIAYVKYCWKTITAFLSLLTTNVATLWVVNGQPLPTNGKQWAAFAVTTIGGTILVFGKRNGPKPRRTRRRSPRKAKPPSPVA